MAGLGGKPGVILADCEEVVEMTVEEDWAEVVIASDGIWDVLPPHNMPQASGCLHKPTLECSMPSLEAEKISYHSYN